jgi:hypothetical protein
VKRRGDRTGQDKTRQDKTRQRKTKQDKTGTREVQDKACAKSKRKRQHGKNKGLG